MWGQAFSPCRVKLAQMLEISIKSFKLMIIKCSEKEWQTLLNGKTETFSKVKYIYKNKQMYKKHYMVHTKFCIDPMEFSQNTITWEKRGAENTAYKFANKDVNEKELRRTLTFYQHWWEILQLTEQDKILMECIKASQVVSGKEQACQCRTPGCDPWLGKIPWRRA